MKAAVVFDPATGPIYADFAQPFATEQQQIIKVTASAISHVVKSRASGKHYSFDGTLPFIAGIDGTGVTPDGKRVYFVFPPSPWGSMAQYAPVDNAHCLPLPDGLDDATAAAMANPGMSAWAALVNRANFKAGETVLINGATGSAGQLAVQIARHLGAKKIIATGRNVQTLATLDADATVLLTDDATTLNQTLAAHAAEQIDVIVDYLWGNSAELLLKALAKYAPGVEPVRYVQVGSLSGQEIALPGAVLRSSPIQLMGSGIGSLSLPALVQATGEMLQAAVAGKFRIAHKTVSLSEVAQAWPLDNSQNRTVFLID
ncbi:MAG TPA: zinc-binding alcohol dehydrogenase family protein [Scandinavium sp.]|jgi:NADPH:quinone reductase-like Zn-dependent oxidoreductase|uniref:quinone oxidoreductase family protein n=1 Tax=Scandinavium sp. TaxID=2830653 RepID=UPI002E2F766D|nr:zinc-binding alcohol dehydrogenase family protein [Scandinavium sp.]HEX4502329.1 zinc-binding alcohol dehydrogenase family protein [Scandinavium sp.]